MLKVTIREKDDDERRMVFESDAVVIGRSKAVDVVLPRNNISKRHARLIFRDDRIVLVDLRSTNGTYVNGQRISAPEVIAETDKIYIGDFVLNVVGEHLDPLATTKRGSEPVSATIAMDHLTIDQLTAENPVSTTVETPLEAFAESDDDEQGAGGGEEIPVEDDEHAAGGVEEMSVEDDGHAAGGVEEMSVEDDEQADPDGDAEEDFDFQIDWSKGAVADAQQAESEKDAGGVTQGTEAFFVSDVEEEAAQPQTEKKPVFVMGVGKEELNAPSQTAVFSGIANPEPLSSDEQTSDEPSSGIHDTDASPEDDTDAYPEEVEALVPPSLPDMVELPSDVIGEQTHPGSEDAQPVDETDTEITDEQIHASSEDAQPVDETDMEITDEQIHASSEDAQPVDETDLEFSDVAEVPDHEETATQQGRGEDEIASIEPPTASDSDHVDKEANPAGDVNPLNAFIDDPSMTQMLITDSDHAVAMRGRHIETMTVLSTHESVAKLLGELGYQTEISPSMVCGTLTPKVQATLIQPPIASNGPIILLRRGPSQPEETDAVFDSFGLGKKEIDMLRDAIISRKNVLLLSDSFDTRTRFVNALASLSAENERIVLVEDSAEIQLARPQLVRLNMAALEQAGENLADILPRLEADRLILNTCASESGLTMVNLALDGQDGIIATARGRSAEKFLRRVSVQLGLWSGALSRDIAGTAIAETMDFVIVLKDDQDGEDGVTEIVTVDGLEPEGFSTSTIFGGG
jgi:Flp pilus assembly CpaF family ATPase/pSer/pThr/pTyr-binding forkhead associated (FHA) protein